jgi:hypothetical protein
MYVFDLVKLIGLCKINMFSNLMDLIIPGFKINVFVCCYLTIAPSVNAHRTSSLPHPCMPVCSCLNYIC